MLLSTSFGRPKKYLKIRKSYSELDFWYATKYKFFPVSFHYSSSSTSSSLENHNIYACVVLCFIVSSLILMFLQYNVWKENELSWTQSGGTMVSDPETSLQVEWKKSESLLTKVFTLAGKNTCRIMYSDVLFVYTMIKWLWMFFFFWTTCLFDYSESTIAVIHVYCVDITVSSYCCQY